MSIGNNIKRLRIEKKLTQKKLSELTGISEVMISQYELGLRNPKLENLQKIAKALNVHSLVLLDQISQDLSDELLKDMETEKPSFIDISLLREIFGKIDIKKENGQYSYILGDDDSTFIISELTFDNILESVENFIRLYIKIANEHPESQECFSLMDCIKDMNLQQIQNLIEYAEFLKQKKR